MVLVVCNMRNLNIICEILVLILISCSRNTDVQVCHYASLPDLCYVEYEELGFPDYYYGEINVEAINFELDRQSFYATARPSGYLEIRRVLTKENLLFSFVGSLVPSTTPFGFRTPRNEDHIYIANTLRDVLIAEYRDGLLIDKRHVDVLTFSNLSRPAEITCDHALFGKAAGENLSEYFMLYSVGNTRLMVDCNSSEVIECLAADSQMPFNDYFQQYYYFPDPFGCTFKMIEIPSEEYEDSLKFTFKFPVTNGVSETVMSWSCDVLLGGEYRETYRR